MRELIVPAKRQLDGNAKRLDRHNRHAAHGAAYRQVDHRVLLAVIGRDAVDHDDGEDGDDKAVEEEARLQGEVQQLLDGLDFFVGRGVEDNDDGAGEADCAADLAQDAEAFVEEVGAEYCSVVSTRLVHVVPWRSRGGLYPMSTLSAPKGVTRMAGANAYAAKFATSPTTTAWH